MQLKPAVPTKTAGKSRRRLLVGIGIVVVALIALAVSLAFALTPGDPDVASDSPDDLAVTSDPREYASGVGNAASEPSAGLTRYRPGDRAPYSAQAPLSQDTPTTTGPAGTPESRSSNHRAPRPTRKAPTPLPELRTGRPGGGRRRR